jgi:hypothetical protein
MIDQDSCKVMPKVMKPKIMETHRVDQNNSPAGKIKSKERKTRPGTGTDKAGEVRPEQVS